MKNNSSLKWTGLSLDQKFPWSDNNGQNIWNKMEKFNKTRQEKKSFVSNFACF